MKDLDLASIIKPVTSFVKRFHTLLFFLLISGSLFAAIIVLLGIINPGSDGTTVTGEVVNGSFDQATIDQLEKSDSASSATPGQRVSPFVE